MALISKLKALLGLGGSRRGAAGTSVRVEQEADAESERAVKEPVQDFDDGTAPADESEPPATGDPVDSISGIGPAYSERLGAAGIETVDDLASAEAATLAEATEISQGRIEAWIERARAG